jgi:predicted nucleotidyltransferase
MENTAPKLPVEITRIVKRIVAAFAPEKIILFGSHAYGNVTPDSDLDLLVIIKTDLPAAERTRKISRLLRPRHLPLDIVVRNPQEIQRSLRRVDPFVHEILERGIVLYARSGCGRSSARYKGDQKDRGLYA